jgi:hypothetical protein
LAQTLTHFTHNTQCRKTREGQPHTQIILIFNYMRRFIAFIVVSSASSVFAQGPFDPYGCPYVFAPGDCGQIERFLSSMQVALTQNTSQTTCVNRFWKAGFPGACCGYQAPQSMQWAPSNKVICNEANKVTEFAWDFLRGNFSNPSLANLTLTNLKLGGQANPQSQRSLVNGSFPKWILGMPLEKLEISLTQITGPIPDLSQISLKELALPYNDFTGPLPDLPTSLTFVNMQRNRLSGVVGQIGGPGLVNCNLAFNNLCYTTPVKCGLQVQQGEDFGVEACSSTQSQSVHSAQSTQYVQSTQTAKSTSVAQPTQGIKTTSLKPQSTTILEPGSSAAKFWSGLFVIVSFL